MPHFSIRLFGSMRVSLNDIPLQGLESAKVYALLAYLSVESGQAHTREHMAGFFWPETPEAQARQRLSQSLYNIRVALREAGKTSDLSAQTDSNTDSYLLVTSQSVQFNPHSDHALDIHQFERCLSSVRRHTHHHLETCEHCAHLLQQAVQLYQGDFLSSLSLRGCQAFEEWALIWRERLHRQFCEALANLSSLYEVREDLQPALEVTERWAQVDPLSEQAQRRLMRLLALDGQRTQAIVHYASFRKRLASELGVEPSRELRLLYERILSEESAQSSLPGMPGKLPVPLTPFIGRSNELTELTAWLRDPHMRMITLHGPGGSGKTRLALQAAYLLRYDFPDGLYLVSLSGLGSPEAFLPALANSLSLVFQPDWGDTFMQMQGYLQGRRLMIILDSFEEVLPAAEWVSRLLQAVPDLKLLVTSRTRLNLQAEHVFPLDGLNYPDPVSLINTPVVLEDYSALQLFVSTARQVRPDFKITPADQPNVVRICQLVDGMPLGLILAAGWLETLSPAEIAEEVAHSLDFLHANLSDLPERQRSLRATLNYSWLQLEEDERQAFEKLAVFQGAFSRQAAEQVARVEINVLRRLVDKSMLQASPGSYRMHDLLRQFGLEKLTSDELQANRVRTTHADYYLSHLARSVNRLKSAQRSTCLCELDTEINDLQTAWTWACKQGDVPILARSLEGLCLYYEMRVRFKEGEQACQAGLLTQAVNQDQSIDSAALNARLMLCQAHFLVLLGELEAARHLRQQAGDLLGQLEAQGLDVRHARAMYWQSEGDDQTELKLKLETYQRGIQLYHELGDTWREAEMLIWAGELALRVGDASLSTQYQQKALQLARQLGEPNTLLHSLRDLTYLYFILNQYQAARQTMQEAAELIETLEEPAVRANAQMHLGVQLLWSGYFSEGIYALETVLPQMRSLGYRFGVVFGSMSLGIGYVLHGAYASAQDLMKSIYPESEQGGFPREAAAELLTLGMLALAQANPAQAEAYLQDSVQRYRKMQFVGELGWALGGLALAQELGGQLEQAVTMLVEALHIATKTHSMFTMITCLPAMVTLLNNRNHLEAALRVHRLALRQPMQQNSAWYADLIGSEMNRLWEALPLERQAAVDSSIAREDPFTILPQVIELLQS